MTTASSLELALIVNCAISAPVDRQGAIVWCCMPRFDGYPILHALLQAGDVPPRDAVIAVELEGFVRSEQAYDARTPCCAPGSSTRPAKASRSSILPPFREP